MPIDPHLPAVTQQLRNHRSLVLVAEPGAGKTTRVPPAILRDGLLAREHPKLILLQPRRVAARAAAARIADENHWELGQEVGYQIRFERRLSPHTPLRIMTEGILTRILVDDPFLEGVGAVVLDEFHERNLHTDLAIALLREIQQSVRPDLLILVMSATLEAEPVSRYLGGCPIVSVPGRIFPIQIVHQDSPMSPRHLPERIAATVESLFTSPDIPAGDVLVFLPGVEEIRRTLRHLEPLAPRLNLLLLPLHGSLTSEDQLLALRPANRRKVICATNIAETSLTIDGVRLVIDSGYARQALYDPRRGLDRLELKRISQASATQRAGRAGRTAPGLCLRLWSAKEHHSLPDFDPPEIRRVDLASTVLSLHAWGQPDAARFPWYEAPSPAHLASAERLLTVLGALIPSTDSRSAITPLGRQLLTLPVHPRLARLLLAAAQANRLHDGAALAALLSEKDILRLPEHGDGSAPRAPRGAPVQGHSDLLYRMDLLARTEQQRFSAHLRDTSLDPHAARQVARTRDELLRLARRLAAPHPPIAPSPHSPDTQLRRLLLLAYPDRVARRRRNDPNSAIAVGGSGLRLSPESIVRQAEFFLALDARHDLRNPKAEAMVRIASAIEVDWLEELFPHLLRREKSVVYDEQRDRVLGLSQVFFLDLPLRQDTDAPVDPQQAAQVLADHARPRAAEIFAANEPACKLLARLTFLRRHLPEHPWPVLDHAALAQLLTHATRGKRSLGDLMAADLAGLLLSQLPYPLNRLLEQHAPETFTVPSGSRIRLAYPPNTAPVLAVRLQELFGLRHTPRLAAGRVPVRLELLGPNFRPVQITDDLESFWRNTYPQVRKDLRSRYPKHAWPDDPYAAPPQAKGRARQ